MDKARRSPCSRRAVMQNFIVARFLLSMPATHQNMPPKLQFYIEAREGTLKAKPCFGLRVLDVWDARGLHECQRSICGRTHGRHAGISCFIAIQATCSISGSEVTLRNVRTYVVQKIHFEKKKKRLHFLLKLRANAKKNTRV